MSFIQIVPGFIVQLQPPVLQLVQLQPLVLPVPVVTNEPPETKIIEIVEIDDDIPDLTPIQNEPPDTKIVDIGIDDIRDLTPIENEPHETKIEEINIHNLKPIKNEPLQTEIVEIGIDDIRDLSDEEVISGVTDIGSVSHKKNAQLVITASADTSNGNVSKGIDQGVVQVQGINEDSLSNLETREQLVLNFSKDLNGISIRSRKPPEHSEATEDFAQLFKIVDTTSCKEDREKIKVIEAPVIPVEPHEYTSLAKDKHVCNHCQHASHQLKNIKLHISKMHRDVTTMYQCPYCPLKLKYRSSLNCHIILKHKDSNDIHWSQCYLCEKKFKIKSHLAKHITFTHLPHEQIQDKLKLCPTCGKPFKLLSAMKHHLKFVHNKEPKKRLKCQQCKYTTVNRHNLKLHIIKHHNDFEQTHELQESSPGCDKITVVRYRCDKCAYETYRPQNFSQHKLIHLKPEEIQYLHCYHCSYKSKRKGNLTEHILRHLKNGEIKHRRKCDEAK